MLEYNDTFAISIGKNVNLGDAIRAEITSRAVLVPVAELGSLSTGDGSVHSSTGDGSVHSSTGDGSVRFSTGDGSVHSSTGDGSVRSSTGDGSVRPSTGDEPDSPSTGEDIYTITKIKGKTENRNVLYIVCHGEAIINDDLHQENNLTYEIELNSLNKNCKKIKFSSPHGMLTYAVHFSGPIDMCLDSSRFSACEYNVKEKIFNLNKNLEHEFLHYDGKLRGDEYQIEVFKRWSVLGTANEGAMRNYLLRPEPIYTDKLMKTIKSNYSLKVDDNIYWITIKKNTSLSDILESITLDYDELVLFFCRPGTLFGYLKGKAHPIVKKNVFDFFSYLLVDNNRYVAPNLNDKKKSVEVFSQENIVSRCFSNDYLASRFILNRRYKYNWEEKFEVNFLSFLVEYNQIKFDKNNIKCDDFWNGFVLSNYMKNNKERLDEIERICDSSKNNIMRYVSEIVNILQFLSSAKEVPNNILVLFGSIIYEQFLLFFRTFYTKVNDVLNKKKQVAIGREIFKCWKSNTKSRGKIFSSESQGQCSYQEYEQMKIFYDFFNKNEETLISIKNNQKKIITSKKKETQYFFDLGQSFHQWRLQTIEELFNKDKDEDEDEIEVFFSSILLDWYLIAYGELDEGRTKLDIDLCQKIAKKVKFLLYDNDVSFNLVECITTTASDVFWFGYWLNYDSFKKYYDSAKPDLVVNNMSSLFGLVLYKGLLDLHNNHGNAILEEDQYTYKKISDCDKIENYIKLLAPVKDIKYDDSAESPFITYITLTKRYKVKDIDNVIEKYFN